MVFVKTYMYVYHYLTHEISDGGWSEQEIKKGIVMAKTLYTTW